MMKATVLFTGGKDSTYALHLAYLQGYEIKVLSSIIPRYEYSMLYHRPYTSLLEMQSKSLGLPLVVKTVEEKDMELEILYELLKEVRDKWGVEVVVSGALYSDYQRMRYTMVIDELGLELYSPLWRIDQEKYMLELIENGIEFILLSINTYGLSPRFLGKILSYDDVLEIIESARKYGFNPAFEGGEAETLVVYGPLFRKKLVVDGIAVRKGLYEHVFVIKNTVLSNP